MTREIAMAINARFEVLTREQTVQPEMVANGHATASNRWANTAVLYIPITVHTAADAAPKQPQKRFVS
jgi:tellurite resistance-related uncharacterized protein